MGSCEIDLEEVASYSAGESGQFNTTEQTKEIADKHGWDLDVAGPNILFIDCDSQAELTRFKELFKLAKTLPGLTNIFKGNPKVNESKSEEGYHVRIELVKDMFLADRIMLQACLGSDPKMCLFSLARYMENDDMPIMFFENREKMLKQVEYIPEC